MENPKIYNLDTGILKIWNNKKAASFSSRNTCFHIACSYETAINYLKPTDKPIN